MCVVINSWVQEFGEEALAVVEIEHVSCKHCSFRVKILIKSIFKIQFKSI